MDKIAKREAKKKELKEYKQKYYEEHKEELKVELACECGAMITKSNMSRHKKTKNHIAIIKNKENLVFNEELEKKKEIFKIDQHEFFDCDCGSHIKRREYARHMKSQKHLNFLKVKK
jgi:hypothetical protein